MSLQRFTSRGSTYSEWHLEEQALHSFSSMNTAEVRCLHLTCSGEMLVHPRLHHRQPNTSAQTASLPQRESNNCYNSHTQIQYFLYDCIVQFYRESKEVLRSGTSLLTSRPSLQNKPFRGKFIFKLFGLFQWLWACLNTSPFLFVKLTNSHAHKNTHHWLSPFVAV